MPRDWPVCVACDTEFHPADVGDACPDCGGRLGRPDPPGFPAAVAAVQLFLVAPPATVAVLLVGTDKPAGLALSVAVVAVSVVVSVGLGFRSRLARVAAITLGWVWLAAGAVVGLFGLALVPAWGIGCLILPFGLLGLLIGVAVLWAAGSARCRDWCRSGEG